MLIIVAQAGPITLTSAGIMRYHREAMKGFSLRVWAEIYNFHIFSPTAIVDCSVVNFPF